MLLNRFQLGNVLKWAVLSEFGICYLDEHRLRFLFLKLRCVTPEIEKVIGHER